MASISFQSGQAVRFIGGKYNGFQGNIRWLGDYTASVIVQVDKATHELIEELRHMKDLATYKRENNIP